MHAPRRRGLICAILCLVGAIAGTVRPVQSEEAREFKVGRQFGLIYFPLHVIHDQNLLAKHAERLGLKPVELKLVNLGSATALSETLLSGSVDAAAGAITPMLTLWDKTRGPQKVKAISSLANSVLYLNTNNPKLQSLRDIGDQDRIALSGVGSSMQATLLQMAAAKIFGAGQELRLDPFTVSMPHPEALAALLSGKLTVTVHFATAPFQNIELRDPKIRRLMTSTDILGGYAPAALIFTTQRFFDANPRLMEAFVAAANEANAWIKDNPKEAAELYLRVEPQKMSAREIEDLLVLGDTVYTTTPENSMQFAQFMHKLGRLKNEATSWKDFFFPLALGNGS